MGVKIYLSANAHGNARLMENSKLDFQYSETISLALLVQITTNQKCVQFVRDK